MHKLKLALLSTELNDLNKITLKLFQGSFNKAPLTMWGSVTHERGLRENDNFGLELFLPNIFFCSSFILFSCSFLSFCLSSSIFLCSSIIANLSSAWNI